MGRPPPSGFPAFRFSSSEVAEMDALLLGANNILPTREVVCTLAETFSAAPERAGKSVVQWKQVWNWFQNRRYSLKAKLIRTPGKLNVSSLPRDDSGLIRNLCNSGPLLPGSDPFDNNARVEFEAKSARDGAWYDVATFVSHRLFETGDPEVRVRFAGFTPDEDEWVNVRKHVRHSSIPCLAAECGAILPGDLVLCFQERQGQALYLDAHVLDAQRWRHDVRGCRCRILVRYDHDQSEEIVPLRKLCRRPESDHRLQVLYSSKEPPLADLQDLGKDPTSLFGTSGSFNSTPRKIRKRHKPKGNADVSQSSHSGERSISWMKTEKFDDSNNNYNNFRTSDEPIRDAAAAAPALVIGTVPDTDTGSASVMATHVEGGGLTKTWRGWFDKGGMFHEIRPKDSKSWLVQRIGTKPLGTRYSLLSYTAEATKFNAASDNLHGEWIGNDLASVDRSNTPWVIFTGHRPMYSSYPGNVDPSPRFVDPVEPLLLKNKMDFALWGHVHNYEITCAVFQKGCKAMPTKSGDGIDTYMPLSVRQASNWTSFRRTNLSSQTQEMLAIALSSPEERSNRVAVASR